METSLDVVHYGLTLRIYATYYQYAISNPLFKRVKKWVNLLCMYRKLTGICYIIEHKHFEMFGAEVYECPKTVISREYSSEWTEGSEPYYPVNDRKNNSLYLRYKQLADKEEKVIFGGRLAEYKYYDMHHIVEKALGYFKSDVPYK